MTLSALSCVILLILRSKKSEHMEETQQGQGHSYNSLIPDTSLDENLHSANGSPKVLDFEIISDVLFSN